MSKNKIIDIALIILLYIGISTFPTNLITSDSVIYYLIEALLMAVALTIILLYVRRHTYLLIEKKPIDYKVLLLLCPVVVVAISNFIYAWIMKEEFYPVFINSDPLQILFICLGVVVEEIIFRYLLLGNIEQGKPIVRIIVAAGIFGLCHLTHFFSTFNPISLVVVAYSFGLGLLLGIVYYYSHSLIACIGLHLIFNLCNDFLFTHMYTTNNALWYYIINGIVAVLIGVYVLMVYLLKLRKNPAELG